MKLSTLLSLCSLSGTALAHLQSNKFPGYGFSWYAPACTYACYNALSGAMLACSSMDHSAGHAHGAGPTSPECRASDSPFLTTLASCIDSYCDLAKVPVWQREKFWASYVTGDEAVLPKWTYSHTLQEVGERPTVEFNSSSEEILNQTMALPKASFDIQNNFNIMFDFIEMLQARYAIVLVVIGAFSPFLFSLFHVLPFTGTGVDKVKPYLVYPSSFGTYSVRPIPWILGFAPTIGQSLWIFLFVALNIILTAVNYDSSQPHPWGFPPKDELLAYIGYRTGHIGYALLPLLILFSGRNNFLLWVTNWSYSTYILLHRWVSRVFAVHAIIHSITLLITYKDTGSYPTESPQPYWLWGIVATVLTCAMLVLSHLYFRRLSYEIFLILHIFLAAFVLIGCWYHVILKWGFNFYDNWLYAACAVWFTDRVVRLLRVAKNGLRRAIVTEVDADHVRVDVPGIRWASKPGYVAYAYFPTLSPWRPWENHPFSLNSTALFHLPASPPLISSVSAAPSSSSSHDIEKTPHSTTIPSSPASDPSTASTPQGVTFLIRKSTGLTRLLTRHPALPVLLDAPYPHHPSAALLTCDRLLLLGGGIGITGLLAWFPAHPNVRIAWSVKSEHAALVDAVQGGLARVAEGEREVVVGGRVDMERVLREEAGRGYKRVGVVVCGPAGMCDTVRAVVAGLGRADAKTVWELEVDVFGW